MGWLEIEMIINIILGLTGLLLGYFYFPVLITRVHERKREEERTKERVKEHKPTEVTGHRAPDDVPPPNGI